MLSALRRGGHRAVTIDGIARQVGRARSSLYRRWPSKRHLVAYAVVSEMGDNPAATPAVFEEISRRPSAPYCVPSPDRWVVRWPVSPRTWHRMQPLRRSFDRKSWLGVANPGEALERAQVRGEARRDGDVELVLDMLTGPFYFRTLFGHVPITRHTTRLVVEYMLRVMKPTQVSGR